MRRLLRSCAIVFAIGLLLMGTLALVTGISLGLFLGGLFLMAFLVPYAFQLGRDLDARLLLAGCVTDAVGLVWLIAVLLDPQGSLRQWLGAYALLLAAALAQAGGTGLLERWRLGRITAAGAGVLLSMIWLTAPIWLLHHLQSPALLPWMQRLISVHPLFALNSAMPLSVWTEAPLAYQVMNLNQDVFYSLPASPIPAIVLHALLGCLLLLAARK